MNEELDDTYKVVFRQCYPKLLFYATRLVGTEEAEDVVQDVFVELWRRRDSVVIGEQILAFLYRSVYTKAINLLKHQIIENNYSAAMIEIYERRLQYYQPDHAEVIKKCIQRKKNKVLSLLSGDSLPSPSYSFATKEIKAFERRT